MSEETENYGDDIIAAVNAAIATSTLDAFEQRVLREDLIAEMLWRTVGHLSYGARPEVTQNPAQRAVFKQALEQMQETIAEFKARKHFKRNGEEGA